MKHSDTFILEYAYFSENLGCVFEAVATAGLHNILSIANRKEKKEGMRLAVVKHAKTGMVVFDRDSLQDAPDFGIPSIPHADSCQRDSCEGQCLSEPQREYQYFWNGRPCPDCPVCGSYTRSDGNNNRKQPAFLRCTSDYCGWFAWNNTLLEETKNETT